MASTTVPFQEFYADILKLIERSQETVSTDQARFFENGLLTEHELIEFLCFQAYYERRAAEFIGGWLADTPEDDAFVLLAQQVEDEGNHYKLHMSALSRRGVDSLANWHPEPEWEAWIDEWYPSGADTIERVAAHNVTGELGAYTAFQEIEEFLPADVKKNFSRILPDEQFHMKLGYRLLERYCRSDEDQDRVRFRVMHTLELQQAARGAFNRRLSQSGIADVDRPLPDLYI